MLQDSRYYHLDNYQKYNQIIADYQIDNKQISELDIYFIANAYLAIGDHHTSFEIATNIPHSLYQMLQANSFFLKKNIDQSLKILFELIEKDGFMWPFLKGRAYQLLGSIHYFKKELNDAHLYYKTAVKILDDCGEKYAKWISMLRLGSYYHRVGDYLHQEIITNQLNKEINCLEYQSIHASVDSIKAWRFVSLGEYGKALAFLKRATDYKSNMSNDDEKIRGLIQYLDILIEYGNISTAKDVALNLKQLILARNDQHFRRIECMVLFSKIDILEGKFDNAFEKLQELVELPGEYIEKEFVVNELLDISIRCKLPKLAREIFDRHYKIIANDNSYTVKLFGAWILWLEGKIKESEMIAIKELEQATKDSNNYKISKSSLLLALCSLKKENIDECRTYLRKGWNPDFLLDSLICIGIAVNKLNDLQLAREFYSQYADEVKKDNSFLLAIKRHLDGEMLFASHDQFLNRFLKNGLGINLHAIDTHRGEEVLPRFSKPSFENYDLIIREKLGSIFRRGEHIEIDMNSISGKLLNYFFYEKRVEDSKENLYKKIWQNNFVPLEDNPKIHSSVRKFNKLLGQTVLEIMPKGVRRKSNISFALITSEIDNSYLLNSRQIFVIEYLRKKDVINVKHLSEYFGTSLRTAQRDLKNLQKLGKISPHSTVRGEYILL